MTTRCSDNVNELAAALSKAQGAMSHAKKTVDNNFFKSKYADLSEVWDACRAPLADNGLSITQMPSVGEGSETLLVTRLMHSSGQWIESVYPINPAKKDPQGYGSAMTYARRYTLAAMVGVSQDDDDGNSASDLPGNQKPNSKPAANSKPQGSPLPEYPDASLEKNKIEWVASMKEGKTTANQLILRISTKFRLSDKQKEFICQIEKDINKEES